MCGTERTVRTDRRIPFAPAAFLFPNREQESGGGMTEVVVDLPEELAETIGQRAAALGTTADNWLALVIADVVADLPEEGEGPDDWICR